MNQIGKAFKRDVVHVSKLKPVEVRDGEGNNEWFDLTEPDIETIAPDESVDTFSNPCFRRALSSYTYNQFYFWIFTQIFLTLVQTPSQLVGVYKNLFLFTVSSHWTSIQKLNLTPRIVRLTLEMFKAEITGDLRSDIRADPSITVKLINFRKQQPFHSYTSKLLHSLYSNSSGRHGPFSIKLLIFSPPQYYHFQNQQMPKSFQQLQQLLI
jgi:hypothetical protein